LTKASLSPNDHGSLPQANQLNMELTIESILSIGAPPPGFGASRYEHFAFAHLPSHAPLTIFPSLQGIYALCPSPIARASHPVCSLSAGIRPSLEGRPRWKAMKRWRGGCPRSSTGPNHPPPGDPVGPHTAFSTHGYTQDPGHMLRFPDSPPIRLQKPPSCLHNSPLLPLPLPARAHVVPCLPLQQPRPRLPPPPPPPSRPPPSAATRCSCPMTSSASPAGRARL
jgi:hypothetical protein